MKEVIVAIIGVNFGGLLGWFFGVIMSNPGTFTGAALAVVFGPSMGPAIGPVLGILIGGGAAIWGVNFWYDELPVPTGYRVT